MKLHTEDTPEWQRQFARLLELRKQYPGARDDQLLMDMLLEALDGSEAAPLGYVIQNEAGELFAGYKHPGTRRVGFPIWVKNLENANFDGGKAAIFADLKTAADIALTIFTRDGERCGATPIGLLP